MQRAGNGRLEGLPWAGLVSNQDRRKIECDVIVPAALENQITSQNAGEIHAKLVVEGANGPTTPEADAILAARGITVVPDILANAGGVTVSYFEWVQDQQKFFWDGDEVSTRMRQLMHAAFARVIDASERLDVSWRTAALSVAIERVAEAARMRSLYP